jgi:hypothetical protein
MTEEVLGLLARWLETNRAAFESAGVGLSVTVGPADHRPSAEWVDFETAQRSARLIVWSSGEAQLTMGDLATQEVVLDEPRDITGDIGLEDVRRTLMGWLT